jgi:hypothetical protein
MNLGTHDRLDELSPQRLNTIRSRWKRSIRSLIHMID